MAIELKSNEERVEEVSSSLIGAYLKEVRKVPLLTPDEEIELANRISKGDEAARDRMIRSNLRLVVKIAKAYVNRGVPFMDLIEEGNIGLMKGVEKFKASKGCRFSTYGSWWIKQAIERAVFKQGRTIRIPVHVMEHVEKMKRNVRKLTKELGRDPTLEEIGESAGFEPAYLEWLGEVTQSICSIEAMVDDEGELTLKQTLASDSEDPAESILEGEMGELLSGALGELDERDRKVLCMRYGVEGEKESTLQQIGESLGITRERVRQIEREAVVRLRSVMNEAA